MKTEEIVDNSLMKAALADTASELALAKAELGASQKERKLLENTIAEMNAKLISSNEAIEQEKHRAYTYGALLSHAGFDLEAVDHKGLWVFPAMNHLRCVVDAVDFVGPTKPGDMGWLNMLTAKEIISPRPQ